MLVFVLVYAGLIAAWFVFEWIDGLRVPDRIVDVLVAAVSIGFLCLPAGLLWSKWQDARAIARWPVAHAWVVDQRTDGEGIELQYAYVVAGETHHGVTHVASARAPDVPFEVRVDPDHPDAAVVDARPYGIVAPIVASLGTLGVLYLGIRLVRWLRPRREAAS